MVNPTLAMHSLIRCTPAKPTEKFGLTRMWNADVVLMIDNGVTNLCGKILSKLIHCFLVMLIKVLSFLKVASMHIRVIFSMKSDLEILL